MAIETRIWSFMIKGIFCSSIITILLGLASPVVYYFYDDLGFRFLDIVAIISLAVGRALDTIIQLIVPSTILGAFIGVVIGSRKALLVKFVAILITAFVSAALCFIEWCPYCLLRWQKVGNFAFASALACCFFVGTCFYGLLLLSLLPSNPVSNNNNSDNVLPQS